MPRAGSKLDALAEMLERTGDDPLRLDLVQRAQRFKRSWVDLAEALSRLRQNRAYEQWGYADLQEYCSSELAIRGATVDKLLLSFSTVQRHAPEVLKRDGVARDIPSIDAVDFFSRALGSEEKPGPVRRLDAADETIEQLRSAVFDEGSNVRELRERFQPVLRPQAAGETLDAHEPARKARVTAAKLCEMLPDLPGLTEARIGRTLAALEALLRDLDATLNAAAAKTSKASTSASANRTARAPRSRSARGRA
jgi:hypothetical protein